MNAGRLDERIKFLEPLWVNDDYGGVVRDGWVYHDRWAEVDRKHSKYYNIRFMGDNTAQGVIRVRKDTSLLKSTHVEVDETKYSIDSIVPNDTKSHYEVVYMEDKQ